MHRLARLSVSIALLSLLPACGDRRSDTASSPQPTPAPASGQGVTAAVTAPLIELLPTGGAAEAFPLAAGSYMSGRFVLKNAAQLNSAHVQIGNYGGTSDGEFSVELCKQQECVKGIKSLTGSVDNEYLEISLETPLTVAANEEVSYRISKVGGTEPVALWLYPVAGSLTAIRINDGDEMTRTPKIALR